MNPHSPRLIGRCRLPPVHQINAQRADPMSNPCKPITCLALLATLASLVTVAAASSGKTEPEFHPIWVPPGKSAGEQKPRVEVRAETPVVLELRGHRHADGSLHFQCDHLPQRVSDRGGAEDRR
ncbi:hypothetical protein [uncultured Aquimonas sp.]|uniref:hypothetical protein n=1 Tax=uncultured Aquimonas sp. TaxID=385483 RepID=UPI00260E3AAC|nr:hypothetical protein [uncultured Aquimonas sp.]